MSAILDIPEVRQRVSPLSVEEYHRLDEFNENRRRTELVRGIVIEKVSKSPLHSALVIEAAVSSPALDRENASLPTEAGVKAYWIVLGNEGQAEVYSGLQSGLYQQKRIVGPSDALECASVPGVNIRVADL